MRYLRTLAIAAFAGAGMLLAGGTSAKSVADRCMSDNLGMCEGFQGSKDRSDCFYYADAYCTGYGDGKNAKKAGGNKHRPVILKKRTS